MPRSREFRPTVDDAPLEPRQMLSTAPFEQLYMDLPAVTPIDNLMPSDRDILPGQSIFDISIDPTGTEFATVSGNDLHSSLPGQMDIWSVDTMKSRLTLPLPCRGDAVTFSPDGASLAVTDRQGQIIILDRATGTVTRTIQLPGPTLRAQYTPNDGKLIVWQRSASGSVLEVDPVTGQFRTIMPQGEFHIAADGTSILHANDLNGSVYLYDRTTEEYNRIPLPNSAPTAIALAPDGQTFAYANPGGFVQFFNLQGEQRGGFWAYAGESATDIAFSPDGRTVATAARNGCTSLFDRAGGASLSDTGLPWGGGKVIFSPKAHVLMALSTHVPTSPGLHIIRVPEDRHIAAQPAPVPERTAQQMRDRQKAIQQEVGILEAQATVTPGIITTALEWEYRKLRVQLTNAQVGSTVTFGPVNVPVTSSNQTLWIPLESFTHTDRRMYPVGLKDPQGKAATEVLGEFGVKSGSHTYGASYGYDVSRSLDKITSLATTDVTRLPQAQQDQYHALQAEHQALEDELQAMGVAQAQLQREREAAMTLMDESVGIVLELERYQDQLREKLAFLTGLLPDLGQGDAADVLPQIETVEALLLEVTMLQEATRGLLDHLGVTRDDDGSYLPGMIAEDPDFEQEDVLALAALQSLDTLEPQIREAVADMPVTTDIVPVGLATPFVGPVSPNVMEVELELELPLLGGSAALRGFKVGRGESLSVGPVSQASLDRLALLTGGGAINQTPLHQQLQWQTHFSTSYEPVALHPIAGQLWFTATKRPYYDYYRGVTEELPQKISLSDWGGPVYRGEVQPEGKLTVRFGNASYVQGVTLRVGGSGQQGVLLVETVSHGTLRLPITGNVIHVGDVVRSLTLDAGQGSPLYLHGIDIRQAAPAPAAPLTLRDDAVEIRGGAGVIDLAEAGSLVTGVTGTIVRTVPGQTITAIAFRGSEAVGQQTIGADGLLSMIDEGGITSVVLQATDSSFILLGLQAEGTQGASPISADAVGLKTNYHVAKLAVPQISMDDWTQAHAKRVFNVGRVDAHWSPLDNHTYSNAGWMVSSNSILYTLIRVEGGTGQIFELNYLGENGQIKPYPKEGYEILGNHLLIYPTGRDGNQNPGFALWMKFNGTAYRTVNVGGKRESVAPPEGAAPEASFVGATPYSGNAHWGDFIPEWPHNFGRTSSFDGNFNIVNAGLASVTLSSVQVHIGPLGTDADPLTYTFNEARTFTPGAVASLRVPFAEPPFTEALKATIYGITPTGERFRLGGSNFAIPHPADGSGWSNRKTYAMARNVVGALSSLAKRGIVLSQSTVSLYQNVVSEFSSTGTINPANKATLTGAPLPPPSVRDSLIIENEGADLEEAFYEEEKSKGKGEVEARTNAMYRAKSVGSNAHIAAEKYGIEYDGTVEGLRQLMADIAVKVRGEAAERVASGVIVPGYIVASDELEDVILSDVGGSPGEEIDIPEFQALRVDIARMDRTQLTRELREWYSIPAEVAQRNVLTISGINVRVDTVAGRILAGFYQNAVSLNREKLLEFSIKIESLLGVSAKSLFGLARFYTHQTFAENLVFAFEKAGYKDLKIGTTQLLPSSTRQVNGVHVNTSKIYVDGDVIHPHFDIVTRANDSSTESLYDHATMTLLWADGTVAKELPDLNYHSSRTGMYVDVPMKTIYKAFGTTGKLHAPFKIRLNLFATADQSQPLGGQNISEVFEVNLEGLSQLSTNPDQQLRDRENEILNHLVNYFPVKGQWKWDIGSEYHNTNTLHAADLNFPNGDYGEPTYVVADGVISEIKTSIGQVKIDHGNGFQGPWKTNYLHMPLYKKFDANGQPEFEAIYGSDGEKIAEEQVYVYKINNQEVMNDRGEVIRIWRGKSLKINDQLGVVAGRGTKNKIELDNAYGYHLHFEALLNGIVIDLRKLHEKKAMHVTATDGGIDDSLITLSDNVTKTVQWDDDLILNGKKGQWVTPDGLLIFDRSEQESGFHDGRWVAFHQDPMQRFEVKHDGLNWYQWNMDQQTWYYENGERRRWNTSRIWSTHP